MCWRDEEELYNSGRAFKITCRDQQGVIVTILADNYYGYCKKEVKTQISFAANLFGMCEEEHAGGAIAYPAYILGQDFYADRTVSLKKARYADGLKILGEIAEAKPEGYAIDRRYTDIFYVPENAAFHVGSGVVEWKEGGGDSQFEAAGEGGVLLAVRFSGADGEASLGLGMAAGGNSAARNVLPQAFYGFGRGEIRNIEIDRSGAADRTGIRAGLSQGHGPGRGDIREGLFVDL